MCEEQINHVSENIFLQNKEGKSGGGGPRSSIIYNISLSLIIPILIYNISLSLMIPILVDLLQGSAGSTLWKRHSLSFPCKSSMTKYFPFNEVAGKSRSGSSTANCYCLERCVIFTKATITSQSINTTWSHGTRRTSPKVTTTFGSLSQIPRVFPDCVFPKFPEFSLTGKLESHFHGFSWFPEWLETCNSILILSGFVLNQIIGGHADTSGVVQLWNMALIVCMSLSLFNTNNVNNIDLLTRKSHGHFCFQPVSF